MMLLDRYIKRLLTRIEGGFISFDKCYICDWVGLSEDVKDNKCPVCGSEDMDDIDGSQYDD